MNIIRVVTLVAGSAGLAIAAGMLFQTSSDGAPDALSPQDASDMPAVASLMPQEGGASGVSPDGRPTLLPSAVSAPVSQTLATQPDTALAPAEDPALRSARDQASQSSDAIDCTPTLVAMPIDGAMLEVNLYAPCNAGEALTIAHGPLRLGASFGAAGDFVTILPALSPEAEVAARMADGTILSDRTDVADFANHDRYLVHWTGASNFDLHAYLPGASFGEAGHITPATPASAATGAMFALDAPEGQRARVYTWPAGMAATADAIRLESEIEVTAENCNQAFQADAYLISGPGRVAHSQINVALPDCSLAGSFVTLPGLAVVLDAETAIN